MNPALGVLTPVQDGRSQQGAVIRGTLSEVRQPGSEDHCTVPLQYRSRAVCFLEASSRENG